MTPGKLSSYSDLELALMILLGYYGNGEARRKALGNRYPAAQGLVEEILNSGKIPDGSGMDPEALQKAMLKTFYDVINEITSEVIERME